MKAVRILRSGGPEVLAVSEVEPPEPGPGDVAVDVRCAGLNRADVLQRIGRYPPPAGTRADIPGLEYAGVISEAGEGVDPSVVGQRVMGLVPGAAYAERLVAPLDQTLPIPDELDDVEAAAVPEAFYTAWDALRQAEFAAGESILIHAAGSGVGTAALQLARALGASTIFGTASAGKLAGIAALDLPLDHPIDYRRTDFREIVAQETNAGVDVILELVGATYWAADLESLASRGRLVLIGLLGGARAETDLRLLLAKRLQVIGTVLRSREDREKRELTHDVRRQLLPWLEDGTLRPVVYEVFPLAEAAAAHACMEDDRNLGKIVLQVS